MIDYDKLRMANELADKLPYESFHFDVWHTQDGYFYLLTFEDKDNMTNEFESENIDHLIAKLQTLTQPKAKYEDLKYEPGNRVWRLNEEYEPYGFCIKGRGWENEIMYLEISEDDGEMWWNESELYPTKLALIEAQIEYWEKMRSRECKNEVTEECQHESDGCCYIDDVAQSKCLKCGEFYR